MLKVIGLGSDLRGDDSIGSEIIERMRKMELPVPLSLVNAGADAFSLLEHLMAKEPVLIVDCAKMGKTPGHVQKLKIDEVNLQTVDKSLYLHGFSFAEIYRMAQSIGPVAPCSIIAVEPEHVTFNEPLSDVVREQVPAIINLVLEEAKANAEKENSNN